MVLERVAGVDFREATLTYRANSQQSTHVPENQDNMKQDDAKHEAGRPASGPWCIGFSRFLTRSSAPGGLNVIRRQAWLFCRASSGVCLCWELEEPKGPKGSSNCFTVPNNLSSILLTSRYANPFPLRKDSALNNFWSIGTVPGSHFWSIGTVPRYKSTEAPRS